jgi:CBS domain-containing protein
MVNLKIRSFPVLAPDRRLLGVVSREDVMRALGAAVADGG